MGVKATGAVMARVVCALVLIVLGLGGNAAAQPAVGPYSVEYQLPDGSYASMCLPSEEHRAPHGDSDHCDACIISAGHLLTPAHAPVPAYLPTPLPGKDGWPDSRVNPRRFLSHHGLSRGPPLTA